MIAVSNILPLPNPPFIRGGLGIFIVSPLVKVIRERLLLRLNRAVLPLRQLKTDN